MKAIFVTDMTNDFVYETFQHDRKEYKGKLVAPLGKTIVKPVAKLVDAALSNPDYLVVFLQDLHTKDSEEIKSGTWPEHNMKETPGAETVDKLRREGVHYIYKDDYSAFTNPELLALLKEKEVSEGYVVGLVQEVCIKENANGFLDNGYKTSVVVDATVPFNPYAGFRALQEIEQKGARIISLETALEEIKNES